MSTSVVGDRIKKSREKAGLTQVQLAKAMSVHKFTVSKWERGETSPQKPSDYVALAKTLNVPIGWIRDGKGSANDPYVPPVEEARRIRESKGDLGRTSNRTCGEECNWLLLAELAVKALGLEPKIQTERLARVLELGQAMAAKGAQPDGEMVATILRMVV